MNAEPENFPAAASPDPLTLQRETEEAVAEPATEPMEPAPARQEADRLDPQNVQMTLESGTEFEIAPLKLRQFLRLLRIVTRGAADVLDGQNLNFDDPQEFLQTFVGMVLFSIPEAEEETVEFIQSMVVPKGLTGNPKTDMEKIKALSLELHNPSLDDTVTIVQKIIETEAEDLRALGKRLGAMLKVAEKMGATKSTAPTPEV